VNYEWPAPLEDAWQTQIIPLAQLGQAPRRVRRYSGKHRATRRLLVALTAVAAVLTAGGGIAGAHVAPATRAIAWAVTNSPTGPEPTSATVHWPQTLYTASPTACGTSVWLQIDTYRYSAPADIARVNQLIASGHLDRGDDSGIGAGDNYWHFQLVTACPAPSQTASGTSDVPTATPSAPSSAASSPVTPVTGLASSTEPAPAKSGVLAVIATASPVQAGTTSEVSGIALASTGTPQWLPNGIEVGFGLLLGGLALLGTVHTLGRRRGEHS
jgi:hypothetical protein